MANNSSTRRKAARLLAAGKYRSAADVYRKALRRGETFNDAEVERMLLAYLALTGEP